MALKRYQKTTPTGVLVQKIVVSGAGSSVTNGNYYVTDETQSGLPVFKHETNNVWFLARADYGDWFLPSIEGNSAPDSRYYYYDNLSTWIDKDGVSHSSVTGFTWGNWSSYVPDYTGSLGSDPKPTVSFTSDYTGVPEALFTVASGKTSAIVSVEISGGTNGGTVNIIKNNGTADYSNIPITLSANEVVVIDAKQFLEGGDSFKIASTATGINVVVNVKED